MSGDDMCDVFSGEGRVWPLETVLGEEAWPPGVAPGVARLQQV